MARDQKLHLFPAGGLGCVQTGKCHFKTPTGHAQGLHGLGDGLGEPRCGLLALGAELVDGLGEGLPSGAFGGLQSLEVGKGFEFGQLGPALGVESGQVFGRAAVTFGQRHPQRQPIIQGLQRGRVGVHVAAELVQGVARVLNLRQGAVQRLDGFGKPGLDVGLAFELVQSALDQIGRARRLVVQGRGGLFGRFDQPLGVGQAAVLGVELGPFIGLGRELVELADLPAQTLHLLLRLRLAGGGFIERFAVLAPSVP